MIEFTKQDLEAMLEADDLEQSRIGYFDVNGQAHL